MITLQKNVSAAEGSDIEKPSYTDIKSFLRNLIGGLDNLSSMDLTTAQPLLETMVR